MNQWLVATGREKEALEYGSTYPNFLFGQGIGVFSRGSQLLYDYSLLYGSTESFFIQMFVEIGVFGVVIFGLVLIKAFLGLLSYSRYFASMLASMCIVGMFTPALYGYTAGLCFYFLIILGFYINNFRENECFIYYKD